MQIVGHCGARERTSGHRGREFVCSDSSHVSFDESFSAIAFMSVICNFYENGFGNHREKQGSGRSSSVSLYFPVAIPDVVVIRNLILYSLLPFMRWMDKRKESDCKYLHLLKKRLCPFTTNLGKLKTNISFMFIQVKIKRNMRSVRYKKNMVSNFLLLE